MKLNDEQFIDLINASTEARDALDDLFLMMNQELIVRNTDGDFLNSFAMGTVQLTLRLKEAVDAKQRLDSSLENFGIKRKD